MELITKEEAIRNHRLMWNWIADESLRQKRCVDKDEAFKHFGWGETLAYNSYCWCCAYAHNYCDKCLIEWGNCLKCAGSIYDYWVMFKDYNDYIKAAEVAKQIANLPVREDI